MYNYKSISKAQLIELLNIIEADLLAAPELAKNAAIKFDSKELSAQTAFEAGYLKGSINGVLELINSYKKY